MRNKRVNILFFFIPLYEMTAYYLLICRLITHWLEEMASIGRKLIPISEISSGKNCKVHAMDEILPVDRFATDRARVSCCHKSCPPARFESNK